jgi:hypothetical protein
MLNLTAARFFFVSLTGIAMAACASSSSSEETGTSAQEQITDIASMVQRADGRFDVVCKNGSTEVVTAAQVAANQVCNGGGGGGGNRIMIYGASDYCSNDVLVASVTPATDCTTLSDSQSAWSIKVGGQCINIVDTTVRKACLLNQPGRTLIYGASDYCNDDTVLASIGENTDCNRLSDSDAAWSIKVNGQCINIVDTSVRKACMLNQPNRVLIYGSSDYCNNDTLLASVGPNTDCSTLSDSDTSWSVKVDGQCINIVDTSVRKACMLHQP